jgi:hypothetical protein
MLLPVRLLQISGYFLPSQNWVGKLEIDNNELVHGRRLHSVIERTMILATGNSEGTKGTHQLMLCRHFQ